MTTANPDMYLPTWLPGMSRLVKVIAETSPRDALELWLDVLSEIGRPAYLHPYYPIGQ